MNAPVFPQLERGHQRRLKAACWICGSEILAVDANRAAFMDNPLHKLPTASQQQRFCGAGRTEYLVKTQPASMLFERIKQLGADAFASL